jgi:hypothetical protein
MENIEKTQVIANRESTLSRSKSLKGKLMVSVLIAIGSAVIMFACYLMINGRADIEGMITIVVVTILALFFSIALLDKLGIY